MATKEQWQTFIKETEARKLEDQIALERVIELTPLEASILVQLCTKDNLDGSKESEQAREDVKIVKEILSEKYGFQDGLKDGRVCFWILDSKIAVFTKESGLTMGGIGR